jgi:hypothetical protein
MRPVLQDVPPRAREAPGCSVAALREGRNGVLTSARRQHCFERGAHHRSSPENHLETSGSYRREVRADHGQEDRQRAGARCRVRRVVEFHREETERVRPEDDQNLGDAYTFVAIERHSKLVLNIAMGKRDQATTDVFVEGVRHATSSGQFQITTDGFAP